MKPLIFYPPKAQEKAITEFLETLNDQFEKKEDILPQHILTGIKKGQEDIKNGDSHPFEEFKKQL
jgi:hypothetical protein